jgi:GAF domain-containing protein
MSYQDYSQQAEDALTRLRVRFVQAMIAIAIVSSLSGMIAQTIIAINAGTGIIPAGIIAAITLSVLSASLLGFLRQGRLELGANLLVIFFAVSFLAVTMQDIVFLLGVLTIVASAVLTRWYFFLAINLLVFGKLAYMLAGIVAEHGLTPTPEGSTLVIQVSTLIIISAATRFFISTAESTAREAQRTANLLRATADIGQITSRLLELQELFDRTVELIRDRYGYYHAQVFMVDDDGEYARLVASTGQIGQQLIQRGHRLPVGSQSVIGRVTQTGDVVIARDTDIDQIHARNELLQDTRCELAIPIIDGDRIIGALDVQSRDRDAFDSVDIQALQVMAAHIGTAVRNARLFESQLVSVQENKRLFLESETSLREIQRLNRQLTGQSWQDYLDTRRELEGITLNTETLLAEAEWSPTMLESGQKQRPVARVRDGRQIIAVPILLRGEVIGAIEAETGTDLRQIDTVQVIESIAQRMAINFENARLFEQAQETTAQQQRINQIVGRYQSANTIDELLQITLAELSETLGAEHGMIRLGSPQRPGQSERAAGNGYEQNGEPGS